MSLEQRKIICYFEQYISDCEYSKNLRPKTIMAYQSVFYRFLKMMPEVKDIEDLKPYMVSEFFKRIDEKNKHKKRKTKVSTIRTYYNKLITFFRWLEHQGYLEKDSLTSKITKPPNPTYEDEKSLSPNEISKLISAISIHGICDPFMSQRDMAIIYILLYTGMRKGELLGLRVQDIDFEENTVFVDGKTSKSRKSRYIPMHFSLANQLKNYLKYRKSKNYLSEYLIVSIKRDAAFTEHGLKHWVEKYKNLSGVPFHIHRFRHTFACELAKKGADLVSIMRALGHSSIKMTLQYLRSISAEHSRDYINTLSY